jgi:hypothetical protein
MAIQPILLVVIIDLFNVDDFYLIITPLMGGFEIVLQPPMNLSLVPTDHKTGVAMPFISSLPAFLLEFLPQTVAINYSVN